MGTNYYLVEEAAHACPHCKHVTPTKRRHIGKSSGGWVFALRVYPELGINTLNDWELHFQKNWDCRIEDEYGDMVTLPEMMKIITQRAPVLQAGAGQWPFPSRILTLQRSKVDGEFCVGQGSGTWEYIAREFS